jgi:3-hydroxybutyryl-CoA dehydrogenase
VSASGIRTLVVAGPGAYGRSVAAWAARRGLRVRLLGRNAEHAATGVARVLAGWARAEAAGRLDAAEGREAAQRLAPAASLEAALDGAEALLECLPEDLAVKAAFWRALAGWGGHGFSGSSSIPMAALGDAAGLPHPPVGFHGFVPFDRMGIVEVAAPVHARPADIAAAEALGRALQRRVARVRDQAGFAASRMALAQGLEAMRLLEAGAASRDDLDALMASGYGHPAGPLELSDRIGLDLRLAIAERIFREGGHPAFEPPAILRRLVAEGRTGRAAGRGFYDWDEQGAKR